MREVSIYENPIAAPGFCMKCGSQNRDWFVDLGFDLEYNQREESVGINLWLDGVLYLCCDCINGLVADIERKFKFYAQTHEVKVEFNGTGRSLADGSGNESDSNGGQDISEEPSDEPERNDSQLDSDSSSGDKEPTESLVFG